MNATEKTRIRYTVRDAKLRYRLRHYLRQVKALHLATKVDGKRLNRHERARIRKALAA